MRAVVFVFVIAAFGKPACAQRAAYGFDVVSIRETTSQSQHRQENLALLAQGVTITPKPFYTVSGNRVDSDGYLVVELIADAYGISRQFIIGPAWIQDARFAIHAIMPEGASRGDVPEMLRGMLEKRFHISVSHESRLSSGFDLVKGKGVLHLGPPKSQDLSVCTPWLDVPSTPGGKRCTYGSVRSADYVLAWSDGPWGPYTVMGPLGSTRMELFSVDMKQFATYLQGPLGGGAGVTPVHDATGIEGKWDIVLDLSGNSNEILNSGSAASTPSSALAQYTAVVGKLGLRLEATEIPVEFLRVDRMDRVPTEN